MNVLLGVLGIFCLLTTGLLVHDTISKNRKMILSRVLGFIGVCTFAFAVAGALLGLIAGAAGAGTGVLIGGLLGYSLSTGFMHVLNNMKLGPY